MDIAPVVLDCDEPAVDETTISQSSPCYSESDAITTSATTVTENEIDASSNQQQPGPPQEQRPRFPRSKMGHHVYDITMELFSRSIWH